MSIPKILLVNDDDLLIGNLLRQAALLSDIEVLLFLVTDNAEEAPCILTQEGGRISSIREAVSGVDVVLLDHKMPIPGNEMLGLLREAGLPEHARVVGTSNVEQRYLSERMYPSDFHDLTQWKEALGL
jgi:hypothetical protein